MSLQRSDFGRQYVIQTSTSRYIHYHVRESVFWLKTGEICLDVLKSQWSPAWTISTACTAVRALLESPEPDSPLNIDAGMIPVKWPSDVWSEFTPLWGSSGVWQPREDVHIHVCTVTKDHVMNRQWASIIHIHQLNGVENMDKVRCCTLSPRLSCDMIKL